MVEVYSLQSHLVRAKYYPKQIQNETVIVKEGLNGLFELMGKDEIPKIVKKEPSGTIDLEVSSAGQFKNESNVILGI